ncbi:MAG: Mfa1 family fimbria major subunit [Bacteroidia bacterium]|nr:Mfa1 family fimbria major subunit [Bacteroidia bacterium]
MKLNKLFLVGAIALGLVACKKEGDVPNPPTGEKGFLSVSIAIPNDVFKATGDLDPGTPNENKVTKARVVLYASDAVVEALSLTVANGTGTNPFTGADVFATGSIAPTANRFVSVGKQVTKGTYSVYVFLNPNAELEAATNPGQPIGKLKEALDVENLNNLIGATRDAFLMANADGAVIATVDKATAAEAQDAPVPVRVERAIGKVVLTEKTPGATPVIGKPNDKVTFSKWGVDILNKKYFPVRDGVKMDGTPDDATTPQLERYAKDPNFGDVTAADYFNNFVADYTTNFLPTLTTDLGTALYAPENTMDAAFQLQKFTTSATIQATYTPEGYTAGETWYLFRTASASKYYTKSEFEGFVATPPADDTNHLPGFAAAVTAFKAAYPTFPGTALTPAQVKEAYDVHNIGVFVNSVCYYNALIRHFTDGQGSIPGGFGRYGVVRNNYYKLIINSVKGVGTPYVGPEKPEDPDDPKDAWISVDTQILPWLVREQIIEGL